MVFDRQIELLWKPLALSFPPTDGRKGIKPYKTKVRSVGKKYNSPVLLNLCGTLIDASQLFEIPYPEVAMGVAAMNDKIE